jgi:DNA repair exonuclease SbcCD nuclease subunit
LPLAGYNAGMSRFLFYTDPHLTAVPPRHRIDDFGAAIIAKLGEAYQLAQSEDCEFIAMGGDLFNHHRIFSYELINDLMDVLCQSKLATYAIIGQHDIYAYNPDTFKSSTLAFVARHCAQLRILWEPTTVSGVVLYPSHVWENINDALKPKSLDKSKVNVLLAHHLITNQKAIFETVPTSLFGDGPYDLVLSGDLHAGFEPHEIKGHWFYNPGALARRAIDELEHVPRVAVIEVAKDAIPIFDSRTLKATKPGKDVFGLDIIEVLHQNWKDFDPTEFVDNIEAFEAESVDIHELVQKVGVTKGIRKPVLDYLRSKKVS